MYTEKQRPKKLKIQTAKSKFYDRKKAELQVFFNPYFASDCVSGHGTIFTYLQKNQWFRTRSGDYQQSLDLRIGLRTFNKLNCLPHGFNAIFIFRIYADYAPSGQIHGLAIFLPNVANAIFLICKICK